MINLTDASNSTSISSPLLDIIKSEAEVFWKNPDALSFEEAAKQIEYTFEHIEDVEARFQRFAPFIQLAFPETEASRGILESVLTEVPDMSEFLGESFEQDLKGGKLWLKRDDLLPISGTIKSRGAIYEVLKHAEDLAFEHGLLTSHLDNYELFASPEFHSFFSHYNITVGTTGNLGISVGTMGRALGFDVTVHMSADAKQWKKDYLKSRGVTVIEHETNFTKAVEEGRAASEKDPNSYFVDDEHSEALFLGYTVGGYRLKAQLEGLGIVVDAEHPLFVYLPCGIGGSPTGITFGLKHAFGDHVHCFFAEPTKMPSMLIGLASNKFDEISAEDVGLGEMTVADGLAVPRTSALVARLGQYLFSGGYTLTDDNFNALLSKLYETEEIFLEPAAVAGLPGAFKLLQSEAGQEYMKAHNLEGKLSQATHIAWATGGSMVPGSDQKQFIAEGQDLLFEAKY